MKRDFRLVGALSDAACVAVLMTCGLGVAQGGQRDGVQGRDHGSGDPLTLWYSSPSKVWTDALAIGNGRLGAMVFGMPDHERLQLNDITLWSGGPEPNQNRVDAYKALPAIRKALADGDWAAANTLVGQNMLAGAYDPSYETLGDLNLDFTLPMGPVTEYWRWLDIGRAVSGVEFKAGGDTYRRESFASHLSTIQSFTERAMAMAQSG